METIKSDIWKVFNRSAYLKEINKIISDDNRFTEVQNWMKKTGTNEEVLKFKLTYDGYTKGEFNSLLALKNRGDIPDVISMPWMQKFKEIFSEQRNFDIKDKTAFQCVIEPIISYASIQCDTYFSSISVERKNVIDIRALKNSILKNIEEKIVSFTIKPVVLEMNIANLRNELEGDNPEEKFISFIHNSLSSTQQVLHFLSEYPVLARRLVELTDKSLNHHFKVINRFINDISEIQETLIPITSSLVDIQVDAGDTHNGGQTVTILTFDNLHKLVYKPRSLSVDSQFQELLKWCNRMGFKLKFSTLKMIDKDHYGWQECISYTECDTKEDVENFYYRLGGYISILYSLNAIDFHFENLIAQGQHPYLIDLESIFHPLQPMSEQSTAQHQAMKLLMTSVLGTGLLPIHHKTAKDSPLEVSGIGGEEGQVISNIEYLKNDNTSNMKIERTQTHIESRANRPKYKGEAVNPVGYVSSVLEGFESMYSILMDNKEDLLGKDGILAPFLNTTTRFIVRNTELYARFIQMGKHTDYLQNGLDQQRLIDLMWNYGRISNNHLKIIPSEINDLLQGDIPYFYTKPNSTIIWDSNNQEIHGFLEKSGQELVFHKINSLSQEDMIRQSNWIHQSILTLDKEESYHEKNLQTISLDKEENPNQLAEEIGKYLSSQAVWGESKKDVTWIGVGMNMESSMSLSPLPVGLYDGLMGLSIFYAYLEDQTTRNEYKELSQAALKSVIQYIDHPENKLTISAYYGSASILYGLTSLYELWNDDELLKYCNVLLENIEELIEHDQIYDIIGGSAGVIMVLLKYYELTGSEKVLNIARKLGDHLIKNAISVGKGVGWRSVTSSVPLGGFSHGAAGIALSLYHLYQVTQEVIYLNVCKQALVYQDSLFKSDERLWEDLREGKKSHSQFGWCHGSSGVILAYTQMWKILSSEQKSMVHNAFESTLSNFTSDNHSLCHGDLGTYWALSKCTEKISSFSDEIQNIKSSILNGMNNKPIRSGFPGGIESPNLMMGLSGTGLALLAMEQYIPNVLLLE